MPQPACPNCDRAYDSSPNTRCDGCGLRIHLSCMGLTSDDMARITRSKSKSIKCYCNNCISTDDKITQLQRQLTDLVERKFAFIETKLTVIDKICEENKQLKDTILELTSRIDSIDQYSRRNNLEVQGVLESKGENIIKVVESLGDAIDCPIPAKDIDVAHRVRASLDHSGPRNIIIKFTSRMMKDKVIAAAKLKRRSGDSIQPGLSLPNLGNSIFINEHLTRKNKILYKTARDKARQLGYKYIWIRNCIIHVRKGDRSSVVAISTDADINKII